MGEHFWVGDELVRGVYGLLHSTEQDLNQALVIRLRRHASNVSRAKGLFKMGEGD